MGVQIAKLAFDFMVEHTPTYVKKDARGAWNVAIAGRWKAFKLWVNQAWTHESNFKQIVGDWEDFLSLHEHYADPGTDGARPEMSLLDYYDATRAPGDRGDYGTYAKIQTIMGVKPERATYIDLRQQARNSALAA